MGGALVFMVSIVQACQKYFINFMTFIYRIWHLRKWSLVPYWTFFPMGNAAIWLFLKMRNMKSTM